LGDLNSEVEAAMGIGPSKNVEGQGWPDRALHGRIHGRFLEGPIPIAAHSEIQLHGIIPQQNWQITETTLVAE